MEPDRYQQNHVAYISGLLCLFASIGLFALSLFLLPYLFFNWQYNVPAFIIDFSARLQDKYSLTNSEVAWAISFFLDFPAVILFLIADFLSNRIDKQIYGIQKLKKVGQDNPAEMSVKTNTSRESRRLIIKITLLILIIFIVAKFFNVAIAA